MLQSEKSLQRAAVDAIRPRRELGLGNPHSGHVQRYALMILRSPATTRSGYSLLETIVTVLTIGILAAAAMPRFVGATRRVQAESAAKKVVADLLYARRQARSQGSSETVTFDLPNHTYYCSSAAGIDKVSSVLRVKLDQSPFDCRIVSANFGGQPLVRFNAYGVPQAGGTITLQCGDQQRVVAVDAGAGKAALQ